MRNLPFRDFHMNAVWLEISMIAQDLLAWTRTLCLTGELAAAEPNRLRYGLLHVAGRLTFPERKAILRLDRTWRWATELADAFDRLAALRAADTLNTPHPRRSRTHDRRTARREHPCPRSTPNTDQNTLTVTAVNRNADRSEPSHLKSPPVTRRDAHNPHQAPSARSGLTSRVPGDVC